MRRDFSGNGDEEGEHSLSAAQRWGMASFPRRFPGAGDGAGAALGRAFRKRPSQVPESSMERGREGVGLSTLLARERRQQHQVTTVRMRGSSQEKERTETSLEFCLVRASVRLGGQNSWLRAPTW